MAEQTIKTRIINKHDTEANWTKATNFVPKLGELIIYDPDSSITTPRLKIGNGSTAVSSLGFFQPAWSDIRSKPSYYDAKAIKSISRSGTTFTATHLDGTTSTFTQQDNNTTYSAGTGISLSGTTFSLNVAGAKTALGLGSNAYSSTAYLPLSGGMLTGTLFLEPQTGEGGEMVLEAATNETTKSGIVLDNYYGVFRIFGKPSADGTTVTGTGTPLQIDPYSKTIGGNYFFNGNAATASSVAWSGITGKPSTFTPSSHTHSNIVSSGTMTAITGTAKWPAGFTVGNIYNSGYPFNYGITWMYQGTFGAELIFDGVGGDAGAGTGQMYFRTRSDWATSTWGDWKRLLDSSNYSSYALPLTGGTVTGSVTCKSVLSLARDSYPQLAFNNGSGVGRGLIYMGTSNGAVSAMYFRVYTDDTGSNYVSAYLGTSGGFHANTVYGAVWNDYAEFRKAESIEPGRVVREDRSGTMVVTSERLMPGCNVISDTFGFAIGETDECKTPIAVAGRVLVYTYEPREEFELGEAVCSGPNGTISRMTREEVREYPERIIGTVSEIPEYKTWGSGNVEVNNRIWIKIR